MRRSSKLQNTAEEVVARLLCHYKRTWRPKTSDAFRALVGTILSQNTNGRNRATAHKRLEEMIGITPRSLAEAPVEVIADAIRPAGMYNQRSRVLKQVSQEVLERFDGTLDHVVEKPLLEARELLMSLPGVGPKTADVTLMFTAGRDIVPVDRHIFRITRRIGVVNEKANYGEIRALWEAATPPERREDIHVFLIQFGRETCRAKKPLCGECFIEDLCSFLLKESVPKVSS